MELDKGIRKMELRLFIIVTMCMLLLSGCGKDSKAQKRQSQEDSQVVKLDIQPSELERQNGIISASTKTIYDAIIAKSPRVKECYDRAIEKTKTLNPDFVASADSIAYDIEYDEFGVVYIILTTYGQQAFNVAAFETLYDSCFRKRFPRKAFDEIDFNLSEIVKDYPDGIQKFGRVRVVYDPKEGAVHIDNDKSYPIGTAHTIRDWNFNNVNRFYRSWLRDRD